MIRTILPGFKRHRLRGYDAVQLATALVTTETLQLQSVSAPMFVAADRDLLTAAAAEHLSAENPLSHPELHSS